jgi:hypothetical protein
MALLELWHSVSVTGATSTLRTAKLLERVNEHRGVGTSCLPTFSSHVFKLGLGRALLVRKSGFQGFKIIRSSLASFP